MRSGRLRHVITIQRSTTVIDEAGVPIPTWENLATLRAGIERQSSEESIRNQGAVEEEVVVFHTRYLDGLTTADRIVWSGQPHSIREIAPDARHRSMELRTVTIVFDEWESD